MAADLEQQHHRDALPVGTRVGTYEIESILGQGGFGIVYRSRHLDLDSVVAVKEFLPVELAVRDGCNVHPRRADFVDAFEDARERFRQEAKSLIQFRSHPGVVTCLEFFRANGTAYLVMEYEEGLSLSELLRQREAQGRPFDQRELLRIAETISEALSRVHEAGVLHRDIKPSNILIRRDDETPVLIDFGAAKQEVALRTKSLAPFTEGYAAIEQIGEGKLGPWTDLYAVGAVLWRIVAGGNRPWEPPNPVKVESRLNAKVRGEIDPLPKAKEVGMQRFSANILDAIDKCLELSEQDRVQDCGQLLQILKTSGCDTDQAITQGSNAGLRDAVKPKGAQQRSAVNWRNQPLAVGLVLTLLIAIVGGTVWFGLDRAPIVSEEGHSSRAESFRNQNSNPSITTSSEQDTKNLPQSTGHIAEPDQLAARPTEISDLVGMSAEAQYKLARKYDRGDGVRQDLLRAAQLYRSAAEEGHTDAQYNLGVMYFRGEGVSQDRLQAAEWYRLAAEKGHDDAQFNLGLLEYLRRNYLEAREWLRGIDKQSRPDAHYLLYLISDQESKSEEAEEWLRRAGEAGHAAAQRILSVETRDEVEAARWLRKSADNGDPYSQLSLAGTLVQNATSPQEREAGVRLYRRAADAGLFPAYRSLCFAFDPSSGDPEVFDQIAKWCRLAADHGYTEAQTMLAASYAAGRGVPQDWIHAVKWLTLSKRSSSDPANEELESLIQEYAERSEYEAGVQLANEWEHKSSDLLRLSRELYLKGRARR